MNSCRKIFDDLLKKENLSSKAEHAGLWLDKFLTTQQESANSNEQPKTRLVNEVGTISQPEIYTKFYQRWKQTLEQISDVQTGKATVQGRMAVGLGTESVLETSIKLYHTYGVPYIPASALKGVTASYARDYLQGWEKTSPNYATVFGTSADDQNNEEAAGFVTFYDALYVPDSGINKQALHADVITVHHQDYYQDKNLAPADWDSTTPISFLTATGEYLIALSGPEDWVSLTFDILKEALKELGVGAKTSSGYGRMKLEIPERKISVEDYPIAVLEKKEINIEDHPMVIEINNIPDNNFAGEIGTKIKKWEDITEPNKKLKVAEVILKKANKINEKKFKDKLWYQTLKNYCNK